MILYFSKPFQHSGSSENRTPDQNKTDIFFRTVPVRKKFSRVDKKKHTKKRVIYFVKFIREEVIKFNEIKEIDDIITFAKAEVVYTKIGINGRLKMLKKCIENIKNTLVDDLSVSRTFFLSNKT